MSQVHVHHDPTIPRGVLIAAGALLVGVLGVTGATRLGWVAQEANPVTERAEAHIAPAAERMLHFTDRSDGAVIVSDASSGNEVKIVEPGQGGFFRATVRRMAKARLAKGIGAHAPFRLVRWQNGALSLVDPQTGEQAELIGFGADHTAMFAEMLQ